MVLGAAAGMVGSVAYFKRQNLMSDALSHAALPGVVLAFIVLGEKQLLFLMLGAAISALLGAFFIQMITSATRISQDTAMGMILSVFYGLGIMLLTLANRMSTGNQSGLDSFIYGQAAAMVRTDMYTMIVLAVAVIAVLFFLFKEWKVYLFDVAFAKGIGMSIKGMDLLYLIILVTTIVVGIQAVGVILIAALMIIPAVSARYWTKTFSNMLILAAVFGGLSGAIGTWITAIWSGLPTGPFIVLVAAAIFTVSLLLGKEKGLIIRYVEQQKNRKMMKEQTHLKARGVR
jgi:manganese/zinc/iron transport system permease protein